MCKNVAFYLKGPSGLDLIGENVRKHSWKCGREIFFQTSPFEFENISIMIENYRCYSHVVDHLSDFTLIRLFLNNPWQIFHEKLKNLITCSIWDKDFLGKLWIKLNETFLKGTNLVKIKNQLKGNPKIIYLIHYLILNA